MIILMIIIIRILIITIITTAESLTPTFLSSSPTILSADILADVVSGVPVRLSPENAQLDVVKECGHFPKEGCVAMCWQCQPAHTHTLSHIVSSLSIIHIHGQRKTMMETLNNKRWSPLRRLEAGGVAKEDRGLEGVAGMEVLDEAGLWSAVLSESMWDKPLDGRGSFCCTASSCLRSARQYSQR